MPGVTATQADPDKPSPEDWRPTSTANAEAKERADFLASWGGDDKAEPAEPDEGDTDLEDEDEDLDAEDDDEEEDAVTTKPPPKKAKAKAAPVEPEKPAEDPDDDSDLDDDEEEGDEKPEADPVVVRGMAKLQKQEQRMRQQWAEKETRWQAEQAKQRDELQAEKSAAAEARAALERLKSRVKADPASVLEELGVDDWDYTAKQTFTRSKAGSDPANKEAAARLQAERELKAKLGDVEKKLAEREEAEAKERKQAEMRGKVETYLGGAVKAVSTVKAATLMQKLAASDPDYARARIADAAGRIYTGGDYPDPRAVIKEAERHERAMLRRYGINPRSLAAAPANGNAKAANGAKPANRKAVRASDDDLKMPSRDELLAEDWKL